jgi:hypothetical protein
MLSRRKLELQLKAKSNKACQSFFRKKKAGGYGASCTMNLAVRRKLDGYN